MLNSFIMSLILRLSSFVILFQIVSHIWSSCHTITTTWSERCWVLMFSFINFMLDGHIPSVYSEALQKSSQIFPFRWLLVPAYYVNMLLLRTIYNSTSYITVKYRELLWHSVCWWYWHFIFFHKGSNHYFVSVFFTTSLEIEPDCLLMWYDVISKNTCWAT